MTKKQINALNEHYRDAPFTRMSKEDILGESVIVENNDELFALLHEGIINPTKKRMESFLEDYREKNGH